MQQTNHEGYLNVGSFGFECIIIFANLFLQIVGKHFLQGNK